LNFSGKLFIRENIFLIRVIAKREPISFDLDIFKNYCFKEVYTYTEREFENYLKNKLSE